MPGVSKCLTRAGLFRTGIWLTELEGGVIAHFNSSWCVRVRRDDLLTLQVDGTKGSAVAGLRHCWIQPYGATPRPVWNPDVESPLNYFDGWQRVPEQDAFDNAFKRQWELFLRHVVRGEPFRWSLLEGAKGVQLAEAGMESKAVRLMGERHTLEFRWEVFDVMGHRNFTTIPANTVIEYSTQKFLLEARAKWGSTGP